MSSLRILPFHDVNVPALPPAQIEQAARGASVGAGRSVFVDAADRALVLRVRGLRRRLRWVFRVFRAIAIGVVCGGAFVFCFALCLSH